MVWGSYAYASGKILHYVPLLGKQLEVSLLKKKMALIGTMCRNTPSLADGSTPSLPILTKLQILMLGL
jgi:hypothetical protein